MTPAPGQAPARRTGGVWPLLAAALAAHVVYAVVLLPRLQSHVLSDVDRVGWTAAVAARVASGERAYVDFDVAMPPGGIALLAALQRLRGGYWLLDELAVVAALRVALAGAACFLARGLTTRWVSGLVGVAVLALSTAITSGNAFEYLGAAALWTSLGFGVRALAGEAGSRARRSTLLAGFFAGATLAVDLNAALAATAGWVATLVVVAGCVGREARAHLRRWVARLAGGVALGVAVAVVAAAAIGAPPSAFLRSVVLDGLGVWGSLGAAVPAMVRLTIRDSAYPASLVLTAVVIVALVLLVRRRGTLSFDDERTRDEPPSRWLIASVAAVAVAGHGLAAAIVLSGASSLPWLATGLARWFEGVPSLGIPIAAVLLMSDAAARDGAPREAGFGTHLAWRAAAAFAFFGGTVSLLGLRLHPSASDASPILPVALAALLAALDRAGLRRLAAVAACACCASVFGPSLARALAAQHPVASGPWRGLRVGFRAQELQAAAALVQRSSLPGEEALVAPDDPQLGALLGRPRPPLRGAMVFGDLYPERLVDADLALLERAPPRVIVLHPRAPKELARLYGHRARAGGTLRFFEGVRALVERRGYRQAGTFRTVLPWTQGAIEVWVRP
ncbi:MAG: hypothetical protein IT376_08620 [Polyangiaceae bacterium]|nr:hypothetical protein [Polyangiaceae bacterium]